MLLVVKVSKKLEDLHRAEQEFDEFMRKMLSAFQLSPVQVKDRE